MSSRDADITLVVRCLLVGLGMWKLIELAWPEFDWINGI